jgi:tetratricopeptide (TPR) repeat protein
MTALLLAALLAAPQDSSAQRLRTGQEKIKVRDFDGAIPDFERCLELQPEEYNASFGLGICFWEKEEYRKARDHFARVVLLVEKEKPGAPLPGVHQKLLGCALLLEEFDAAVREATHLLQIQTTGEYYYARALARRRKGDARGAIEDCDAALKEDALLVKARTLKADVLLARGETEAALAEYGIAIQARPSSREGYLARACAFYRLERWADALADLRTARKVNRGQSSDLEDQSYIAAMTWLVQTRSGQKEAARNEVTSYRGVLKELQKDPSKNHLLALPLALGGELPEADLLRAADGALARKAQARCEANFFVGERRLLDGDLAGAREHFRRSIEAGAEGIFERDLAARRLQVLEK